jgi:hypothetical protein
MRTKAIESLYRPQAQADLRAAGSALCLALMLAVPAGAQSHPVSPSLPTLPSGVPANSRTDYDIPSSDPAEEARRLRAINDQRQKALASDASKLFKLAAELNAEIARTNADSLTKDQLRKLARIEKLARSVKDRMKVTALPN